MGEDINRLEERDIFENDWRNVCNIFGNLLFRVLLGWFLGINDGINERVERFFNLRDMMIIIFFVLLMVFFLLFCILL